MKRKPISEDDWAKSCYEDNDDVNSKPHAFVVHFARLMNIFLVGVVTK